MTEKFRRPGSIICLENQVTCQAFGGRCSVQAGYPTAVFVNLIFIGPCIILIVEQRETNLMPLALLFLYTHNAQHVSDVNTSILRTLRLIC